MHTYDSYVRSLIVIISAQIDGTSDTPSAKNTPVPYKRIILLCIIVGA